MISEPLVAEANGVRKAFVEAVVELEKLGTLRALESGSEELHAELDAARDLAVSAKLRQPFRCHPQIRPPGARVIDSGSTVSRQLIEEMNPVSAFERRYESQLDERVVKLICAIDLGPDFLTNSLDRREIKRSEIRSSFGIQPSPAGHSARSSLFERRVVQKCIRSRIQDLLREGRCFNNIASNQRRLAALD